MVAEDPLHVLTIRARLAAIARRAGRVLARQRALRQHLAAVQRGQRDLGGRDQVERAALVGLVRLEELLLELGQLAGAQHRVGIHEMRQPQLRVAVLARLHIQHELGDGALEPRQRAPHDREARLRQLRGTVHVEQAEAGADGLVRPGLEVEPARRAPAANLDVLLVALAGRHRWVREVRDLDEQRFDGLVDGLQPGIEGLDAVADLAHPRLFGAGVLTRLLRAADRLGGGVALGLEVLDLFQEPAALDVLGEDLRDELGAALLGERALDLVGSLANEPQIEHGTTGLRPGWCFRPRRWRSSRPCRRRRGR